MFETVLIIKVCHFLTFQFGPVGYTVAKRGRHKWRRRGRKRGRQRHKVRKKIKHCLMIVTE